MKRKYKLKKSAKLIIVIFIIIIIALLFFVLSLFKTKSYSIEYNIDDYKISEYYDNANEIFYYEINKDSITYNFIYPSKYLKERKLINSIETYSNDKEGCITISSDYITTSPLCHIEKELVDYHLVSKQLLEKIDFEIKKEEIIETTYKNYTFYNNDIDLYIWNYKGFNHVKNGKVNFIGLFEKDIYENLLTSEINNFLVVPDYSQEYTYNKVYLINLSTDEVESWTLKSNISFDSYILGSNKKSLYIIDKKNKREYELVPHKKKMRILATSKKQGVIYINGEEKKVPMQTLVANQKSFTYNTTYNYKIIDNKLYLSYWDKGKYIKVSNNISSIACIKNDTIYYFVDSILYRYTPEYGEAKIAEYSEWAINNNNVIFINS